MTGWKRGLLLFLFSPVCLHADWKVVDRHDWPVAEKTLTVSAFRVENGTAQAEINLAFFPISEVKLEVIENTDGQIRGLRELIESQGGLIGVNGGYFQANLDPVGLLISNGRLVHSLQKAKLLSGIFYLKNGRFWLARTREFPGVKGVQQAIQCGPFLVDGGRAVAGLDQQRVAARTFVFSCGPNLSGFGICRSVTLEEMGDILVQAAIVPNHPIGRALNFDGGSSTTFYARVDGQTIFSEGRPVVSNYLLLKARD
jgi:exopolysaccharide biosynthesis protein